MGRLAKLLPNVLAFLFGVGLAASTTLRPGIAAAADEWRRIFSGEFCAIRFFSPTKGLAVTTNGLLVTDGSATRWKGIAGWDRTDDILSYAGGDEKTIYLVSSSREDVVVGDASGETIRSPGPGMFSREKRGGKIVWVRHDYTFTLVRWTASTGFEDLRTLPRSADDPGRPAKCTFVNSDTGAFGDGRQVFVTRNAGRNWTGTEVCEKPRRILSVLWTDPTHLAITEDRERTVMGLELDTDGHVRERWQTDLQGNAGEMKLSPDGKMLWVYTNDVSGGGGLRGLQAISSVDGKKIRVDWPLYELRAMRDAVRKTNSGMVRGEDLEGFVPTNASLYVWGSFIDGGGSFTAVYDLATKKIVGTAVGGDGPNRNERVVHVSDHSALLVIEPVGQLLPWDERSIILPEEYRLPETAKSMPGAVVDSKLLDEAEERRPGTEWRPSFRENRACEEARQAVAFNRRLEIVQERDPGDFDNFRQYRLWLTERYRQSAETVPGTEETVPKTAYRIMSCVGCPPNYPRVLGRAVGITLLRDVMRRHRRGHSSLFRQVLPHSCHHGGA